MRAAWPRAAAGFGAVLRLDGAALELLFPGRRIVENRRFDVRNMALDVLEGFGGAKTGEPGFLLVPHGLGSLCRFNKTREYETPLLFYAGGDRGLTAPVFGTARGSSGFLGVISQGDCDAELVLAANAGPGRNLTSVHPRIRMRFHSADPLREIDHEVRYIFLSGDDASPAGMARAYRTYLIGKARQLRLSDRMARRPLLEYAVRAPAIHVELAEKRRLSRMTGDGELLVKTSFAEVPELAKRLREANVETATIVLVGWNCEGRDGLYPTRFPVESAVGGADAMSRALAAVKRLGFHAGALDNFTDMYRRSPAFNAEFEARQLGGEPWRGGAWAGGHAYIVCPKPARERHAQRDMRRLRDLGVEGTLHLDHCPGPGVLQCHNEEHPLTRSEWARCVREIIDMARSTFGVCRVSGPSVFAALAADSCVCPAHEPAPIDELEPEWFTDERVPFLPIALHGMVLLAAEADEDPLRVAEYGAVPIYTTSAGEFGSALPSMSELCRRYTAELAPLATEFIETHESPEPGIIKVGYSNGVVVLINRTDGDADIEGTPLPPRNFLVKR